MKARAARRRASKRARLDDSVTPEANTENQDVENNSDAVEHQSDNVDTFGGFKWECIAVTHPDYKAFLGTLERTKDPDEKVLRKNVIDNVLPIIEKAEEAQRRKIERKEKEMLNMQKMAGAKRSSRLAGKQEKEKQEREAAEAERKRIDDLRAAQRNQERQQKMDIDRESRMMTREQRIKDREYKRILREEELRKMEEEAKKVEVGALRGSERHLKAQMDKTKKDLEKLEDEDDWTFDCSGCGIHGANLVNLPSALDVHLTHIRQDDGTAIISCEKCNVWQHMKCLGISKTEAAKAGFTFHCRDCQRREEEAKLPKIAPLKFRVGTSSSPPSDKHGPPNNKRKSDDFDNRSPVTKQMRYVEISRPSQRPPSQLPIANTYSYPQAIPNGSPQQQYGLALSDVEPSLKSLSPPRLNRSVQNWPRHSSPSTTKNPLQQISPYLNGARQASSPHIHQTSPPTRASHFQTSPSQPTQTNSTYSRPASREQHAQYSPPRKFASNNSLARTPSVHSNGASSSVNGATPYPRPSSSHSTSGTTAGKLPSPVQNRPSMSPTQGNPDVGPLAGFDSLVSQSRPGSNDIDQSSDALHPGHPQSHASAEQHTQLSNNQPIDGSKISGSLGPKTPTPIFRDQQQQQPAPKSGLSPTKHSPSQAPSTTVSVQIPKVRTVSGTPVFPPAATLQPSPEAARMSPMPTPMKDGN